MKRILSLVCVVFAAASCVINVPKPVIGNGLPETKRIEPGAFGSIEVIGSMDIIFTPSEQETFAILHTDENLIDLYSIEVENGVLKVSTVQGQNPAPKTKTYLTVFGPAIEGTHMIGSGSLRVASKMVVPGDFSFSVTGSGDLDAESILCKDLKVKIAGSGDVSLGTVEASNAYMSVSGSGDISVRSLAAETVSLSISGSGDAVVACKEVGDVTVRISGSGDVKLTGSARTLDSNVSGSGKVDYNDLSLTAQTRGIAQLVR